MPLDRGERRSCPTTGKQCYGGRGEAKRAHAAAHYRIRPYRCDDCGAWHVTNGEKRHRQSSRGDDRRRQEWGK